MDARTKFASRLRPHGASCALHLSTDPTRFMAPALSHHDQLMTATTFYQYAGGDFLGGGAPLKVSIANILLLDLH